MYKLWFNSKDFSKILNWFNACLGENGVLWINYPDLNDDKAYLLIKFINDFVKFNELIRFLNDINIHVDLEKDGD